MKLALIFISLFILTSCSSLKPEDCNYEYGYAEGMNDGKRDHFMYPPQDSNNVCSYEALLEAQRGYREGYKFGVQSRTAGTGSALAEDRFKQKRECVEAYGTKICGYNCVTGYGLVKCADRPDHRCLAAFGTIKCGANCIAKFGSIECQ